MKIMVQIIVEYEELDMPIVEEIGCLCRGDLLPETLGLTLEEGKELLAKIQEGMVMADTSGPSADPTPRELTPIF